MKLLCNVWNISLQTVKRMIQGLVGNGSEGRVIVCDRGYTSEAVLDVCEANGVHLLGTINKRYPFVHVEFISTAAKKHGDCTIVHRVKDSIDASRKRGTIICIESP